MERLRRVKKARLFLCSHKRSHASRWVYQLSLAYTARYDVLPTHNSGDFLNRLMLAAGDRNHVCELDHRGDKVDLEPGSRLRHDQPRLQQLPRGTIQRNGPWREGA